jgi:squalene synthase HpnC
LHLPEKDPVSVIPSPRTPPTPVGLPDAQAVFGRVGGENFTVASRLLPPLSRGHLLAFYGYARFVDQIGDAYGGDRLAALDWVDAQLDGALGGTAGPVHPLIGDAARSLQALGADPTPLRDLVDANRRDQHVTSYDTFEQLLDYCRLSAAPVGRLVLAAFEALTPERVAWSDAVCTALQLAEHWQDVGEDRAAGRVYLPAEDRHRFGVADDDLRASRGAAPSALRALLAFEAARARRLLDEGAPLVGSLRGRARLAVAGFVAGGHATLDALAAARFDPLRSTPRPTPVRIAWHTVGLLNATRKSR